MTTTQTKNYMEETKQAVTANGELVLVTGAAGYVACHVIQQLQRAGYRVRGTVRDLTNDKKCQAIRELCPDAKYPVELVEADLKKPETWPAAVAGCDYVLNIATPNPFDCSSKTPGDDIITQTVDGALNILRAARDAGCVRRVVWTSGLQALQDGFSGVNGRTYTESDWLNFDKSGLLPVERAKALAERAAWDFVNSIDDDKRRFELSVVHPGFVMGPALSGNPSMSIEFLQQMLAGKYWMVPRMCTAMVDVRDVAAAHIAAMTSPQAAGQRHILCGGNIWFKDIANTLRDEFHPQGYCISNITAPYFVMWIAARFDDTASMILRALNAECHYDNTRMIDVLGVTPRPLKTTILETAYALIESGLVKKTDKYTGPNKGQTSV